MLIDDLKARRIANFRELNVVGTIGILLEAKEKGIIHELKPLLEELTEKGIRMVYFSKPTYSLNVGQF